MFICKSGFSDIISLHSLSPRWSFLLRKFQAIGGFISWLYFLRTQLLHVSTKHIYKCAYTQKTIRSQVWDPLYLWYVNTEVNYKREGDFVKWNGQHFLIVWYQPIIFSSWQYPKLMQISKVCPNLYIRFASIEIFSKWPRNEFFIWVLPLCHIVPRHLSRYKLGPDYIF